MENKGISAAGLVVIVIVIAAAGVGGYLILGGGGGGAPGGLAEYPGAESYNIPSEYLPEGLEAKVYSTSDSVSDVMTWYKGHMSGWTLDNTHSSEAYGLLVYTKGDDGAAIYAFSYGGTTVIELIAGSKDAIFDAY